MNNRSLKGQFAGLSHDDKALFKCLVEAHYRHVFVVCFGILGNAHDAEDMAQETLLKGFLKREHLDDATRFKPWITTVARNACVDFLRRQKRQPLPLPDQRPESRQESNAQDELEHAIERLSPELRVPLMMYYFDGRDTKSIAHTLNLSHSSVCQKLRAARNRLHELIAGRPKK